jgi:hypothetical protein
MPAGRPPKLTKEVILKLEEAFLLGCSDLEACLVADISKTALYNYQAKHPEFVDRKEMLKKTPIYKARKCVVEECENNPDLALKYLERKNKKEFSLRQENINADVNKKEFEEMTEEDLKAENAKLIKELGYGEEE